MLRTISMSPTPLPPPPLCGVESVRRAPDPELVSSRTPDVVDLSGTTATGGSAPSGLTAAPPAPSVNAQPPASSVPAGTSPSTPSGPVDPSASRSYPRQIIIIRHAEKPETQASGPDDPTTAQHPTEDTGLSPRGVERANALAQAIPQRYPHIDYLIATAASAHSNRSALTITPLAQKLGQPIDQRYANDDYDDLAHDLLHDKRYAGKTILIAWHHGKIPSLVEKLDVDPPEDPWPNSTFDRIWQIDFNSHGRATVQNLPQHLLPGDS